MKKMIKFRQYAVYTSLLAVPVFIALSVLSLFQFFRPNLIFLWSYFFLFYGLTVLMGYYNLRGLDKPIFGTIYMGTSGIKLLASLTVLFLYMNFFHPPKWVLLPFALIFLIFKGFELLILLRELKKLDN